jgi:DNA-directed RNA polymerase specialized sigma24 family protein
MVRPISSDLRQRVLELYLSALSRQEISDMTGVATGSVSNIMDDERGRTQDIDALREVSRALRKRNISWVDAARGSTLLDRLDQI